MASEAIVLQQLNKNNVKDVVKLFEICFHYSHSTKHFLDKYNFEDTQFTNLAYLVYYNSEIAGFFGVTYEEMILNNKIIKGVQSADTMINPNFRRKRLLPIVANKVIDLCKDKGVDIAFGFPNELSLPSFTNKLGFEILPPLRNLTFIENKFELLKFTSKVSFLRKLHQRILILFLKLFTKHAEDINVTVDLNKTFIHHSNQYLNKKGGHLKFLRKISKTTFLLKIHESGIEIGLIGDTSNKNLKSSIKKLTLITILSGYRFINYGSSKDTELFDKIKIHSVSENISYNLVALALNEDIKLDSIRFFNFNVDVF